MQARRRDQVAMEKQLRLAQTRRQFGVPAWPRIVGRIDSPRARPTSGQRRRDCLYTLPRQEARRSPYQHRALDRDRDPGSGAQVAQLVEHATENRSVGGSIPPLGTIAFEKLYFAIVCGSKVTRSGPLPGRRVTLPLCGAPRRHARALHGLQALRSISTKARAISAGLALPSRRYQTGDQLTAPSSMSLNRRGSTGLLRSRSSTRRANFAS